MPQITDEQLRHAAKRIHHREGELEIDADGIVSRGDDSGAYVAAWVWVDFEDVIPADADAGRKSA